MVTLAAKSPEARRAASSCTAFRMRAGNGRPWRGENSMPAIAAAPNSIYAKESAEALAKLPKEEK